MKLINRSQALSKVVVLQRWLPKLSTMKFCETVLARPEAQIQMYPSLTIFEIDIVIANPPCRELDFGS